jgi:hypothetical protein
MDRLAIHAEAARLQRQAGRVTLHVFCMVAMIVIALALPILRLVA